MTNKYVIDSIPGDGIGVDVTDVAMRMVDAVAELHDFSIEWRIRDWNSDLYKKTGRMMPVDGIEQLATGDGIYLGAVGTPDVPDDITLWGLLIPLRRKFDQYINLRPMRLLPGVKGSMPGLESLDVVVVRENVEGEYSTIGGRFGTGTPEEFALQEAVFTRKGITRVAHYAAKIAASRNGKLVSATKSNGIIHSMPFWDEVVAETLAEYPAVEVEKVLIDALAARVVMKPTTLSTIVASNLFGDILSDLVAGVAGSIGIAPSANLNPERRFPSMFEPVHGSAPDIAGKGIANPIGALWAAAMMLEHLGETAGAQSLTKAFESALADGIATPDLGGTATTESFADAVRERLS
ncbi:tartrate dehydrogenase [Gulosibacter chungangensis]|uniref:D-malate dehydrogenase (decarboxylating) n=1 Tax=Gulosibacter chungangensis TaxID=979746 RepID=A0A7J5BHK5_9MICO|nr:tartrate dehydrogenase [Gulosibacter chungangensis]KAB1644899.1 tartrate dehydrogenase [Gulosibacter chungangensis]